VRILGISAFYHDSAAALVVDGEIAAAAQEERFTRIRHDSSFPTNAVNFCLRRSPGDLDHVVFYDKPFLKFERLLETYLAFAPKGLRSFSLALPIWLKEKAFQRQILAEKLGPGFDPKTLLFTEHHQSHAASAFFPSPFEEAAVLTMDGVGEWATTSVAIGRGNQLEMIKEIHFPHSLGLLYSAFTYYTGFTVNSGEYKLMGLAPYGEPKYASLILDRLIDVKPDGSFRLDLSYFDYCTGLTMTNERFEELFGGPVRRPEEVITPFHMNVAASIQAVLNQVVLKMTRALAAETGMRSLCLAGGVALNCITNGNILRDGCFQQIWIQPAAGDAGGALGAALAANYLYHRQPRTINTADSMHGSYLGSEFPQREIEERLEAAGAEFVVLDDHFLIERCAEAIEQGKALGWFQGRMEFGPRALGARSILADARSPEMQSTLNLKVKRRESFRPFAPSVLRENAADWFELDRDSPYMLMTAAVKRSTIPAVTHVDSSARVQTVDQKTNPRYHALISTFTRRTGCPVIVNTSFNVRGEPMVESPEDAFRCFMGTEIDALAIGNCFLLKEEQDPALKKSYEPESD
jgi:carbamoyltransferase